MNIVFFGATHLGYKCCEALIESGHHISGIFTIKKRFNISYSETPVHNVLYADFSHLSDKHGIQLIEIDGNLRAYQDELERMAPNFILAIGWYYMIPKPMLNLADKGAAGIHASLLPKYRGNAPLVWAMINGEKQTGVSFFYFDEGVDTGDIIGQRSFPIEEEDDISNVLVKAEEASINLLLEKVPEIENDSISPWKQNHSEATYFPKRAPEDGLINWDWDAERIRNFIRAQTKPYPGAFTIIKNKKVIIWDADLTSL